MPNSKAVDLNKSLEISILILEVEFLLQHKYCFITTNCTIYNIKNKNVTLLVDSLILLTKNFIQTTMVQSRESKAKYLNASIQNCIY